MTSPHVIGEAIGLFLTSEHREVVEGGKTLYEYDVRCGDCGALLGSLRFSSAKIIHDPADCGLICGGCSSARDLMVPPEPDPAPESGEEA